MVCFYHVWSNNILKLHYRVDPSSIYNFLHIKQSKEHVERVTCFDYNC